MAASEARRWRAARRRNGPVLLVRRFLANTVSIRLLRLAHQRAAPIRLGLGLLVGALWFGFGLMAAIEYGAREVAPSASQGAAPSYAASPAIMAASEGLCILQSGKPCDFDVDGADWRLRVSQTAFSFLAILTLLFGFWTQLLSAVARALRSWGAGHVIVAGDGAEPDLLARDVARRGRRGRKAVVLLRTTASQADIDALAADGVAVLTGPLTTPALLRAAGVRDADRIVLLSASDSENIAAAAAVRKVRAQTRAGDVLVRLENPRARRDLTGRGRLRSADVFSLADIAARQVVRTLAFAHEAEARGHARVHIAIVGWDETAAALAAQVLRLMWLPDWQAPRVTVFAPDAQERSRQFRARHPQAFTNPFWIADIDFREYHWEEEPAPWAPLESCAAERGPITAVCLSWPDDDDTLRCAAVLAGEAGDADRPLLLVREGRNAVVGLALDSTATLRIETFGAPDQLLSAEALVDRAMDDAARLVHDAYIETVVLLAHEEAYLHALRQGVSLQERVSLRLSPLAGDGRDALENAFIARFGAPAWWRLRARTAFALLARGAFTPSPDRPAQKPWDELAEHYINGNRSAADHALIKLWRLRYRPARAGERGGLAQVTPDQVDAAMSDAEHRRWAAELLLAGWRRGPRNDSALTHPDLRDYSEFPAEDLPAAIAKDRDPWLVAPRIGRAAHPRGFVVR
ncbi:MAG: NAD-binding protein [Hyphomonadaceae bacterium]|nr:NAD-binding protein [Hyphomonadaceae bacterium]